MAKKNVELKIDGKKELGKLKDEASAFKDFISRGNVVDMAVGVIIGSAFGKIVTSLVSDMLMPVIGVILGGLNFTDLSIKVGDATVAYGNFIQTIIDFLIISLCIFTMIRLFDKFKKKEEKKEEEAPKKSDEVVLLEEIRDLLKKRK
jgi:large conductance mechanosensitive channel